MANPRQRNKARSHKSTKPSLNVKRRIHQKLRRAPAMKGPEVLQENWDKKKTVFQNYAALGLLPNIPLPPKPTRSHKASLPFLPPHLRPEPALSADAGAVTGSDAGTVTAAPKVGFGRIIRDADGNVVDIIIDEEPEAGEGIDEDGEVQQEGILGLGQGEGEEEEVGERVVEAKTDVVRSLEALAASSQPVSRHSSTSERQWLSLLAKKHDDDYERMARDKQLNVWQKTPGEIKRMIKKAGGLDKLKGMA